MSVVRDAELELNAQVHAVREEVDTLAIFCDVEYTKCG